MHKVIKKLTKPEFSHMSAILIIPNKAAAKLGGCKRKYGNMVPSKWFLVITKFQVKTLMVSF